MRQIKFRCWTGKWFITDDFNISPEGWVGEMTSTGTYNSFDYIEWKKDWIVQQFTGLLDKNGKEIYEGDILFNDMSEWKYSVSWDDLLFAFILNHAESQTWIFLHEMNEDVNCFEVIGNIYENSNLLEK